MDWLKSLFELHRLPARIAALIAVVTGCLLLLPDAALEAIQVHRIREDHGMWVGMVFLASAGLLVVNVISYGVAWWRGRRAASRRARRLADRIQALDPHQKSVLREFHLQDRQVIRAPIDDSVVAGLLECGILEMVGRLGRQEVVGLVHPIRVTDDARPQLRLSDIDLPEGSSPAALKRKMESTRPWFMRRGRR